MSRLVEEDVGGRAMYDGDYKDGECHGLGIAYWADDGRVFRGEWLKSFWKEGETSYLEGNDMRVRYSEV